MKLRIRHISAIEKHCDTEITAA